MSCLTAAARERHQRRRDATSIMAAAPAGGNLAGIDTHTDTMHIAVISSVGGTVDDREFPTTPAG